MKNILIFLLILHIFILTGCAAKVQESKPETTGTGIKDLFPKDEASIPGWKLRDEVIVFDKKTIFDHINGAAEAYLARGFQLCAAAEYNPADKSSSDEFILVDIYDMAKPEQALDMYKIELYPDANPLDIETVQGYRESSAIIFWKDRYYVKIIASSEEQHITDASMEIAEFIAQNIS
ncbi:hypothetical protein GF312_01690 [Candidatus Poribacteria bacterium]|nr:hypothetical protein [Candidatus Poribacteria bacterium]